MQLKVLAPAQAKVLIARSKFLLVVSVCLASILSISAASGSTLWLMDLTSHFRMQYLVFLLLALPFVDFVRNWKIAALGAVAIGLNFVEIAPAYLPGPSAAEISQGSLKSSALKVVTLNINYQNANFDDSINYIKKENPEVFGVEELTEPCLKVLKSRLPEYKFVATAIRTDPYGIGMFSRIPLTNVKTLYLGSTVPSINAEIDYDGKIVSLLVTHPLAPVSPFWDGANLRQLSEIGKFVEASKKSMLVFGDLNATPWCPSFRSMISNGHLVDSRIGFGQQPSWMRVVPFLAIPIDHFLTTHDLKTVSRKVGPFVGSDHWPVCVEVERVGTPPSRTSLSFDSIKSEPPAAHRI
jgi:endonuclease/exonuclease/phosphatase (EEP) superfamily protein YafD